MNKFYIDLAYGQKYEKQAAELLKEYDKSITNITFNYDYRYDLKDNNNRTYEIKVDRLARRTGNFFIEYATIHDENELASGLTKSEAEFYILSDLENFYRITTKKLKRMCKKNNYQTRTLKTYPQTKGYLIPISDIVNNSIQLNLEESDSDEDIFRIVS